MVPLNGTDGIQRNVAHIGPQQFVQAEKPWLRGPVFQAHGAVGFGKIEGDLGADPTHLVGVLLHISGVFVPLGFGAVTVGNAGHIPHPAGDPAAAAGIQNPGLPGIGNQEGVVVPVLHPHGCIAALAVFFQQGGDHMERFVGGCAPLKPQTEQIHTQQAVFRFLRFPGPDGFVADRNSFFVHAVFKAPDPVGLGAKHTVGVRRLWNLNVGTFHGFVRCMICGGIDHQRLCLGNGTVAVFGKNHMTAFGTVAQSDHGITRIKFHRDTASCLCKIWGKFVFC